MPRLARIFGQVFYEYIRIYIFRLFHIRSGVLTLRLQGIQDRDAADHAEGATDRNAVLRERFYRASGYFIPASRFDDRRIFQTGVR